MKITKYIVGISMVCNIGLSPFVLAQENQLTSENGSELRVDHVEQPLQMPDDYPSDLLAIQSQQITPAYVVVDQATHKVLMEKAAQEPMALASVSKIISVYLIYQAIAEGRLHWEDQIPVSEMIVAALSNNPDASSAHLQADQTYSVTDLLHGILIPSGSDATSALMTYLYGSEQAAVQACRDLLQSWGITDFEFYTVSGLPLNFLPTDMQVTDAPAADSENKMSAADVALVAQHLIEDYPQVLEITSKTTYTFAAGTDHEQEFESSNQMLPENMYGRAGVTGLKSGTGSAGQNLVITTTENDRPLIMVVLGIPEGYSRYIQSQILLDVVSGYPYLYQLDLPSNYRKTLAEVTAESVSESVAQSESESLVESSIIEEAERVNSQKWLKRLLIGGAVLVVVGIGMLLVTKRLVKDSKRKLGPNVYLQNRKRKDF